MCFEIIELRDLKCDLFQAFLAKFSQTKNSTKNFKGKVVAIKSVMVTDWNGKSLSCTFGIKTFLRRFAYSYDVTRRFAR